jgi:hypothetical protein
MDVFAKRGSGWRNDLTSFLASRDHETPAALAIGGAGLLIAVCIIHLQDQSGLLGSVSPLWLKWGYYLVEVTSLLAAVMVLRKWTFGWVLGVGATLFPFIGYVLSRSVGIPGDSGDVGNWGYLLGTVSLVVEATFVVVASICLRRIHARFRVRHLESDQLAAEVSYVMQP